MQGKGGRWSVTFDGLILPTTQKKTGTINLILQLKGKQGHKKKADLPERLNKVCLLPAPSVNLRPVTESDATCHYWQELLRSFVRSLTDGGTLRGSEAHPPNALADKWPHYSSTGHVFLIHRTPTWWLAPRETLAFEPCQAFGLSDFPRVFFSSWLVAHNQFPGLSLSARNTETHHIFNLSTLVVCKNNHRLEMFCLSGLRQECRRPETCYISLLHLPLTHSCTIHTNTPNKIYSKLWC